MKTFKLIILLTIIMCITYKNSKLFSVVNNDSTFIKSPIIEVDVVAQDSMYNDKIMNKFDNYADFKETNVVIPILDKFIPQGITLVRGSYIISGYFDSHESSKCYVINEFGEIINIVELDTTSHVGAISYDEKRDLLWIPDNNGVLNAYNVTDFFTKKEVISTYKFDYVSQDLPDFQNTSKSLIAYLCVDGDYLYIGNFFIERDCTIKKYKIIESDNKIELNFINKFVVSKRTQGIDFFESDNKKYMVLSQSYGRENSSYLYIYQYEENKEVYNSAELKKIKLPPMLEQVSVYDSQMYLLFESNASKYWNCKEKMEYVIAISLLDLLKDI